VRLKGADRIRRIDYLPAEQLMTLVRGARAMLFPALCEGFGLPALEAMALGVPVLAGAAGALPELVGEAGLLVDPYDGEALKVAIQQLDRDSALRAQLGSAGLRRAATFSMEAYRARLAAVHRTVLDIPLAQHRGRRPVALSHAQSGAAS
jgi:glycosyltransferase involved in cell wall biosynthesis